MKIYAITYFFSDVPDFGSIICQENGAYFYPSYFGDRLIRFNPIDLDQIGRYLVVQESYDISYNSERIYAYYCEKVAYLGNKDKIKGIIRELLAESKIYAASSLIEALEFLESDNNYAKTSIDNAYLQAKIIYAEFPNHIRNFEDIVSSYLVQLDKKTDPENEYSGSDNIYMDFVRNMQLYTDSQFDKYYNGVAS